ncbi:unnamed protein product [Rotaria magnacalcarata]|uniref:Uncharacterized protein n=1 Tax=Rotaria magnacalcarata TaxID=392030 RepID=A0A816UR56_9BILA|nr:unnamed protein product [Rotaria magnacalcarata]
MSHPSKSQQRFPFRATVHIRKNFRKLPPITKPIRPLEEDSRAPSSSLSVTNVDLKYESPPPIGVDDFWNKLHQQIANQTSEHNDDHGNQNTPNKVVRIFVSSTFTDFFNEREVLIKKVRDIFIVYIITLFVVSILKRKVFPALRDEMEPAGLQIIDCDLRWGVSKIILNKKS